MIGGDDETVKLKSRCVPLIFDCPRKTCSKGCPFGAIRQIDDVVDRVNWIKAMTLQELRDVLKHHSTCIEEGRA